MSISPLFYKLSEGFWGTVCAQANRVRIILHKLSEVIVHALVYLHSFKHLLQNGRLSEPTQPIGLQPNLPSVVGACGNAIHVELLARQPGTFCVFETMLQQCVS